MPGGPIYAMLVLLSQHKTGSRGANTFWHLKLAVVIIRRNSRRIVVVNWLVLCVYL